MKEFLTTRSLFLEYWNYTLPATIILITIWFINYYRKARSEIKLSEAEYIGEYEPESNEVIDDLQPFLEEDEHVKYSGVTSKYPGSINDYYNILNNRRSVRNFSKKSIDFEIIKKCIHAAGTAPSGAHTEPWSFCVVSKQELKIQIREIVENEELENYAQRMSRQWTTDLRPLKTNYIKEYLTDAPYLILIFKQIYGYRKDGQKKQHYYNEISTSIATGILLTALQCAGLNSLVTTPLNCGPALRALLNRPNNEKLLVLIPVGYAADDCHVPNLQRKNLDEILFEY